ncbi:MAG: NUDIX hydrolase [Caldisericia bacterium]|nr:NUDIX hydrolase [Caldisericia bacterium]
MKKIDEKFAYKGKWIGVLEKTFECENGDESKWEVVTRVKNPISMTMIAQMKDSKRVVLIRQYRPAIENYVIAFPAGLSESNDIKKEALRELKEETGYTGTVNRISPKLCSNAGLFSDFMHVIEIDINEKAKENLNPKPKLESSEEIEVILVEKKIMQQFLSQRMSLGDDISVGVWYSLALMKSNKK